VPDAYAEITKAEPGVLEVLIAAMELRAADPRQQEIRERFFSTVEFPEAARVLEAGCGSGAVCRELVGRPQVAEVVGLDPSPAFLARARELAAGIPDLTFDEGDARSLPYEEAAFDVVVFHTCLTHVPGAETALEEAFRVLRPGGRLAVLDGDYATTTVAIGDNDPLQMCADAAMAGLVNDRWLTRRLPSIAASAGFRVERFDSHGYLQTSAPDYMLTLVDRGADLLATSGRIDPQMAEDLKREARRRTADGRFFGFIAFGALVATKPA
jgi:ubiquinone/menaquinone biosynthesis C-methylase UbiE